MALLIDTSAMARAIVSAPSLRAVDTGEGEGALAYGPVSDTRLHTHTTVQAWCITNRLTAVVAGPFVQAKAPDRFVSIVRVRV